MVGLAFQNLANADNIGYVIPTPIIRRFLEDVEDDWKAAATHMPRPRTKPGQAVLTAQEKEEGEGYPPRGILLARDQVPAHG